MLSVLVSSPACEEMGPDMNKQMAMLNVREKVQVCTTVSLILFLRIISCYMV
jgi:hypothetical protein